MYSTHMLTVFQLEFDGRFEIESFNQSSILQNLNEFRQSNSKHQHTINCTCTSRTVQCYTYIYMYCTCEFPTLLTSNPSVCNPTLSSINNKYKLYCTLSVHAHKNTCVSIQISILKSCLTQLREWITTDTRRVVRIPTWMFLDSSFYYFCYILQCSSKLLHSIIA